MNQKPLPWYYTVNDLPVKMIETEQGGMDVLVLNLKTGNFERDLRYLSRCFDPSADVDELTEESFYAWVRMLLQDIEASTKKSK